MPRMPATNTKSPARVPRFHVPVGLIAPSGASVFTPFGEAGNGWACAGAVISKAASESGAAIRDNRRILLPVLARFGCVLLRGDALCCRAARLHHHLDGVVDAFARVFDRGRQVFER